MAFVIADRVLETSTTTGSGNLTLAGAVTGFRTFASVCAASDTFPYYIEGVDASGIPTGEWETGLGTYPSANTLARSVVLASSNSGSVVTLSAGTKRVAIGMTAGALTGRVPRSALNAGGLKRIPNRNGVGSLSILSLSSGWVYYHAFEPGSCEIATGMGVEVTTASTGNNLMLGLYKVVDGNTLSLVAQAGPLSLSSTGFVTATFASSVLLTESDYIVTMQVDGGTSQVRAETNTRGILHFDAAGSCEAYQAATYSTTLASTINPSSPAGYRSFHGRVFLTGTP